MQSFFVISNYLVQILESIWNTYISVEFLWLTRRTNILFRLSFPSHPFFSLILDNLYRYFNFLYDWISTFFPFLSQFSHRLLFFNPANQAHCTQYVIFWISYSISASKRVNVYTWKCPIFQTSSLQLMHLYSKYLTTLFLFNGARLSNSRTQTRKPASVCYWTFSRVSASL